MLPRGSKLAPTQGSQVGTRNKEANLQNSSLKLVGVKICYFVCGISMGTSTMFVHKMPLGSELAPPWGSQVEQRNKERKFYYSSSLKLEYLELWYFVFSISLWTSTKYVNKIPLGSKLAPSWGSQVEHMNKEQKFYNSSSLKLDGLELWYLVCSIFLWTLPSSFIWCPKGQDWSCPGGHKLEHRNKEDKFQIFSSLKVEGLQLWYLVCSIS